MLNYHMSFPMVQLSDKEYKEYLRGLNIIVKRATDHPDGLFYKVDVKCVSKHCKEVREYMKTQGFDVELKKSFDSDHYGIKRFKSPEKAIKVMNDLYKKYNKSLDKPMIKDASVFPIIPSKPHSDKKITMTKKPIIDGDGSRVVFITYSNNHKMKIFELLKTHTTPYLIIVHQKRNRTERGQLPEGFWIIVNKDVDKEFLQSCEDLDYTDGISVQSWDVRSCKIAPKKL